MPEIVSTAVTKIYENTNLTVKARIDKRDVESIEEVTFKFLKDGEQFEEKTIPMSQGHHSPDHTTVSHTVKAPAVPDDKDRYFLDYHYFYKVKSAASAESESLQNFPSSRIQVFPRVAQLKVTDKDGKAFPNFEFMVEQDGQRSEVRKTVVSDTPNAKGETIPAGSCEFNLGLFPNFRIVPSPPYDIAEETVGTGRKREIKGAIGFRAIFAAPKKANIKQYVNYDVENLGQGGYGHAVTIEVGVHPDELPFLKADDSNEVHFRVTYGPAGAPFVKSERDDADHPTKVTKVSDADATATIEEKEAKKKYEGKVKLTDGAGKFVVGLGKAGGDTCTVEISGSPKFLTDNLSSDSTLQFENWRRVYYELLMPDCIQDRVFPPAAQAFEKLGQQLFIEFIQHEAHVFDALEAAGAGTIAEASFLGNASIQAGLVYILSPRNWRTMPRGQAWSEEYPGRTLLIIACDALLKWRRDTEDSKKGTSDFSGTVTEATCTVNIEDKFSGVFMPASGDDGSDGIAEIRWTADISKDDSVCKYTPALEIKDVRDALPLPVELYVELDAGENFPPLAVPIVFRRLSYPDLDMAGATTVAKAGEADDGKVTLKEPTLGKELTISGGVASGTPDELDGFFKKLFSEGHDQLAASEEANKFTIEVHAKTGTDALDERIRAVVHEAEKAYERTFGHDQHVFKGELTEDSVSALQSFVNGLLADHFVLYTVNAKVSVTIQCPKSTGHGEDDCLKAVKDKLQEVFDAAKKEFSYHPGLDKDGQPLGGSCAMIEATIWPDAESNKPTSTLREWHFQLPETLANGMPGPVSFVGTGKTADKCPVKIEFSVLPHEQSVGEVDGKLIAWVCDPAVGAKRLMGLCLRRIAAVEDKASLEHGHSGGKPGDCLADAETLCDNCAAWGRARNLIL
jgi:hypothetical protein